MEIIVADIEFRPVGPIRSSSLAYFSLYADRLQAIALAPSLSILPPIVFGLNTYTYLNWR